MSLQEPLTTKRMVIVVDVHNRTLLADAENLML